MVLPSVSLAAIACVSVLSGCAGSKRLSGSNPVVIVPNTFSAWDGPGGGEITISVVTGINNLAVVAGYTVLPSGDIYFTRSPNGTIARLTLADTSTKLFGINNSGVQVGEFDGQAITFSNGITTPVSTPGLASSIAFGINDSGIIVGQGKAPDFLTTPGFVKVHGNVTLLYPTLATKADSSVVSAQGVNNRGLVIGNYREGTSSDQHGFTYDIKTQTYTLLPDPSTERTVAEGLFQTQFMGLNDYGEAVGYYETKSGSQYGFLFDLTTGTYTYVDEPDVAPVNGPHGPILITQIVGVNNSGMIAGFYIDVHGAQRGFTAK